MNFAVPMNRAMLSDHWPNASGSKRGSVMRPGSRGWSSRRGLATSTPSSGVVRSVLAEAGNRLHLRSDGVAGSVLASARHRLHLRSDGVAGSVLASARHRLHLRSDGV